MPDTVLIPLGPLGVLKMPVELFEAHLVRPEPIAAPVSAAPELVPAGVIARENSLAKSCVYEYAKAGRIPSVRIGKHVRFDRAAVRAALERPTGTGPDRRSQVSERPRAATRQLPRTAPEMPVIAGIGRGTNIGPQGVRRGS